MKFLILGLMLSGGVMARDIEVKVSGMVCSMCAQGIQKKFSQYSSIENLKVDLDSKTVFIKTKGEEDLSDKNIQEAIFEAGYNVTSIKR